MPKISVIIPAYNVAGCILRALESILSQDCQNLEIIIVNDGSTDNLEDALKGYIGDERIKYLITPNRGVSHAINSGLKIAKGEYICFLHADDTFLPGKIKKQVSKMENFLQYDVSYTSEDYFLEGTDRTVSSPYFHFSGDIFYFIKRNNFIHMSTTMFRRRTFETLRFDETLGCHEDWDLFLKLSAKGIKFLYLNEPLSNISIRVKNLSSDVKLMDETRSEVGKRARRLWWDFKSNINLWSVDGILNLKRYIRFKTYAKMIGFPTYKKFNPKSPRDLLLSRTSRCGTPPGEASHGVT